MACERVDLGGDGADEGFSGRTFGTSERVSAGFVLWVSPSNAASFAKQALCSSVLFCSFCA